MAFVHLHNHSEYSLLDGAQRIPSMVARAKEFGMPALAISDHGVMYGVLSFYLECKRQGIKPILGMEAYVSPQGRHKKTGKEDASSFHLLLLAKNEKGYVNLCKLATIASLEGYYYKPRIDHEILREYSEGLIGTTTCLGSEVCQSLLNGDYQSAKRTAELYKDIFGEENYYVELQDHGLKEQLAIREGLLKIASELNLPLVCTNDSHYLDKGDADAHDVLLCIQTNSRVTDSDRLRFETKEFYLKSPQEMKERFTEFPQAIENTLAIAERCNVQLEYDRVELPDVGIPEGVEPDVYLRQLCEESLSKAYPKEEPEVKQRLEYELDIIKKTGFAKYFLLVRDFAQYARRNGIYYGVRGSAAGSLVSYLLEVTNVDPLQYGLTFERFLNPERVQMPDIDMDFEDARRDEILQYVRERFGEDHVAQIITFGTLGAKAAMRDAGRALGMSLAEVDRLCKMIGGQGPYTTTIEKALELFPEFRQAYENDLNARRLIDTARTIEGVSRHAGVHAAGVVISKEPLIERMPLARGSDGQVVTQYPMDVLESLGLLKMDLLGLSNLTVLSRTIDNIKKMGKGEIDINSIPLDDKETYEMLGRGETVGVFQLEGEGMRRYVMQLKPESIKELTAMVALYRPGPMEHIPAYIEGKFKKRKPKYLDPRMEPILRETYGVITYQDQVLQLVQTLAGFSLGKADILRRAMGKKDRKLLASMKVEFMMGCAQNGVSGENAQKIWELLEPFAGYAFNKAHAVCYALLAYQTAYLKAHYPVEFMTALLSVYREKEERVVGLVEECRRMKIEVLPPDISKSGIDFVLEDGKIRFGLGAIKGIGEAAVEGILKAREEGPFTHLYDFALRIKKYGGLNRSSLQALIRAGALDSIDPNRNKLLGVVDTALAWAERVSQEKEIGQSELFEGGEGTPSYPILPEVPPPTREQLFAMEREVLGAYIHAHPLHDVTDEVNKAATHSTKQLWELSDGTEVTLAGVIANVRETRTKTKKELMATIVLEDLSGQVVVTVFPQLYEQNKHLLRKDKLAVIRGQVRHRDLPGGSGKGIEVIMKEVRPLRSNSESNSSNGNTSNSPGTVRVRLLNARKSELKKIFEIAKQNPGDFELCIEVLDPSFQPAKGEPPKVLTSVLLPLRVGDGKWLRDLRLSVAKGYVFLERRNGIF
ncbi:MAG TPA: DNA polymerase III subunit alpha [Fimbriimonadales bacterium]|nr:DNA polymerase III subunit alpha [Fimbriimonadales bacterium]